MGKKHREGFTLIELLMLMMVVAITLGLGVPAVSNLLANARMATAGNDLVASLHAARVAATTRNRTVTLCASSNWDGAAGTCEAEARLLDGWIAFVDDNADGVVDAAETLLQGHGPLDAGISGQARSGVDAGPPEWLAFRGDGLLTAPAGTDPVRNIQLCDTRGNRDTGGGVAAGRWIVISPAGRPAMLDRVDPLQGPANPLGGC